MDLQSKDRIKGTMKVGIVILNWNNYKDTKECLNSIKKQSFKYIEVVIVDGKSTDDSTKKISQEFPEYHYIFLKTDTGYSGGNNSGIKYLLRRKIDYILSMNNDIILDNQCVEKLVEELGKNPQAGIVGPRMYSYSDPKLFQISGGYVNVFKTKPVPKWVHEDKNSPNKPFQVIKLPGACLLVRRTVIQKVGLMDDGFFLYYADTDWEKRISDAGWLQVSVPSAKAYHKVSATTGMGSKKILFYDSRDFLFYVKKHHNFPTLIYAFIKSWVSKNITIVKEFKPNILEQLKYLNLAYIHFLQDKRGKGI